MLKFINENPTLATCASAIISALITAVFALIIQNQKNKADSVKTLKAERKELMQEVETLKSELSKCKKLMDKESHIDKSKGSIYYEKLEGGNQRPICGYCWEKDHATIPILTELCIDEDGVKKYYLGRCSVCDKKCIEDNVELPF